MLKTLNGKFDNYTLAFKDSVCAKIAELDMGSTDKATILDFIYTYPKFVIDRDDMVVRKRVKNVLPDNNRCIAKRANGEQCTRRRKECSEFCGTHSKGTPNGVIDDAEKGRNTVNVTMKVLEIEGIVYHIDDMNRVYDTEDIINGSGCPRVVGNYNVELNTVVVCN